MNIENPLTNILHQFNLSVEPTQLPGGSQATFRVGDIVLKQVKEASFEKNHSPKLMTWIAQISKIIYEDGFRISKPIATPEGDLITSDGWTAWTFLAGRHARQTDIPRCIKAIIAFHRAMYLHHIVTKND